MNSLALIQFKDHDITIHGTQTDPLIKCTDLLIHVLGYTDCKSARWFRKMVDDQRYVQVGTLPGQRFFTELGVYKALMKSNKPIAEQFQDQVCSILKKIRIQQSTQLEEAKTELREIKNELQESKKELEESKKERHATIYKIKMGARLLYVGKDTSKLQNRPQSHFTARRQIVANYQQIDIFLATQQEQDIQIEIQPCLDHQASQIEQELIQNEEPECNQVMSDKRYACTFKRCTRIFKMRLPFQKHLQKHYDNPEGNETD